MAAHTIRLLYKENEELRTALAQRNELRDKLFEGQVGHLAINPEIVGYVKPQREWVGLTDAEIDVVVKSCNTTDTYKYFRAIEAKLKEKNA